MPPVSSKHLLEAWFALLVAGLVWSLYMLRRNNQVHKFRQQLVMDIGKAIVADVTSGHLTEDDDDTKWRWRYAIYNSVTYHQMVLQFWRPLDSFYPDQKFAQPLSSSAQQGC